MWNSIPSHIKAINNYHILAQWIMKSCKCGSCFICRFQCKSMFFNNNYYIYISIYDIYIYIIDGKSPAAYVFTDLFILDLKIKLYRILSYVILSYPHVTECNAKLKSYLM